MRGMFLIARRDLAAYFNSIWGYLVVAALLFFNGLAFNVFAVGKTSKYSTDVLEDFFYWTFGFIVTAAVLLTMRLIAEERQTGTIVLLDSSPLSDWQIVGGKYLSAMGFLTLMIALTGYMPALIFVEGKVSYGHIAAGYTGLLLTGSAVVAIGTFASSLSKSQLVAAVIAGVVVGVLVLSWLLGRITEAPLSDVFSYLSLYDRHFQPFQRGRINLEDVVYYLSLTFAFLMLSTRWMAARRWR